MNRRKFFSSLFAVGVVGATPLIAKVAKKLGTLIRELTKDKGNPFGLDRNNVEFVTDRMWLKREVDFFETGTGFTIEGIQRIKI